MLMCVILCHHTEHERDAELLQANEMAICINFSGDTVSSITHYTWENSANAFRWSAFCVCLTMLENRIVPNNIPTLLHIHLHLLNVVIFIMQFFSCSQSKQFVATCTLATGKIITIV